MKKLAAYLMLLFLAIIIQAQGAIASADNNFSVTVGENKTFTDFNLHNTEFSNDEGNPPPRWAPPAIRTASSEENVAKLNLLAYPGQAGRAQTRIGLMLSWEGIDNWDSFEDMPVKITYDVGYTLSANWYSLEGSASTRFYTPVKNTTAQDMMGFPYSVGTVYENMRETQYTTVKQLGQNPYLELSLDAQVHKQDVGPMGNNPSYQHTASGEIIINSIEVKFGPKAVISGPFKYNEEGIPGIDEGKPFNFDASNSINPSGNPLQYRWFFDSSNWTNWQDNPLIEAPNEIWQDGGSFYPYLPYTPYNITLEVKDPLTGETDTANESINIYNLAPAFFGVDNATPILAKVGDTYVVKKNQVITFYGQAADPSPVDMIDASWEFDSIFPPALYTMRYGSGTPIPGINIFTEEGLHFATLWIKDDDMLDGDAKFIQRSVIAADEESEDNQVPVIDPITGKPLPGINIPVPGTGMPESPVLLQSNAVVEDGQPLTFDINIPSGAGSAFFGIFKSASIPGTLGLSSLGVKSSSSQSLSNLASNLNLYTPDGTKINVETAVNSNEFFYYQDDTGEYYVANNPASGNWKMELSPDSPQTTQNFMLLSLLNPILDNSLSEPNSARLEMDVSHNWVGGNNFPPNTPLRINIKDGATVKAYGDVQTDENGNFETDFWNEDNSRITFGNTVEVRRKDNNFIIKTADISQLNANMDIGSSTISGSGLANSKVRVGIFENEPSRNEVVSRDRNTDANGDFSFNFSQGTPDNPKYIISGINEAEVEVEDSSGDRTRITIGSPALEVNVSHGGINGKYFPADTDVNLEINNGKGELDITTNSFGEFNADWQSDDSRKPMAAGDTLTASFNGKEKTLTFQPVSNVNIGYDTDNKIKGSAPANTWVQTNVERPEIDWRQQHRNELTNNSGAFTADYSSIDEEKEYSFLDLIMQDEASIRYYKNDSLDTVQYWFGQPRLKANISHNWIEGNYLPENRNNLKLKVEGSNLNFEKTDLNTDSNGFFNLNWWDTNKRPLQSGDQVSIFDGSSLKQSMTVSNLSIEPDYDTNVVQGDAPTGTRVYARANQRNQQGTDGEDIASNNRFNIPLSPYDLTKNDEIWVENYDSSGLNQTISVKDPTKMKVNLSHQWMEAEGLTPGQLVDVIISNGTISKASIDKQEVGSNGRLHLDSWQVQEILINQNPSYNGDFTYNHGDQIQVSNDGTGALLAQMTAANPLTINVTKGSSVVSGEAPPGDFMTLSVSKGEDNDWQEISSHDFDVDDPNGKYSFDFSQAGWDLDLDASHVVTATLMNADDNETSVVGAFPRFEIWDYSSTNIGGEYFQPGEKFQIKVNGAPIGDPKIVNIRGAFNSWQEGLEGETINPGQTISATRVVGGDEEANPFATWLVPELTADIDFSEGPGGNRIFGLSPNGKLSIQLGPWWIDNPPPTWTGAVTNNSYDVDFMEEFNYNLGRGDWGRVSATDELGNTVNIWAASPTLTADTVLNKIHGESFNEIQNLNLEVRNSNGGLKGTKINIQLDEDTFEVDDWEINPSEKLEAGDVIVAKDGQNEIARMTVAPLNNPLANYANDSIDGTTTSGFSVRSTINKDDTENPFTFRGNEDLLSNYASSGPEQTVGQDGKFSLSLWLGEDEPRYNLGTQQGFAWINIEDDGNNTIYGKEVNDITPAPFSFADQTGISPNSQVESNQITVLDVSTPTSISITGGLYSINGQPYTSVQQTVSTGDLVKVWQTASSGYSTTTNATLTIGEASDTFSVTTVSPPPPPPPPVITPAPSTPPATPPAPVITPKKKKTVITPFHKKKCKNKKYHASHCKSTKNKKQAKKNKKFHSKKCSKTILAGASLLKN